MSLMLEGTVDTSAETIADLEREVQDLKRQLRESRIERDRATAAAAAALTALRRQLTPLYRALQMVFGELDAVPDDAPSSSSQPGGDARTTAVWDAWKERLGGQPAKVIGALQLHGEMNAQQIAIAIGCHRNTVPNIVSKLNRAGLINKNGGRYSLKTL